MKASEISTTKYLKRDDVPAPVVVTITNVTKENVALPNEPQKMRGVIHFQEFSKGMVLNSTNLNRLIRITGSDDTEEWKGEKVVVYTDENIEFGGKIVGGLRIRSAKSEPKKGGRFDDMTEDVPFADPYKGRKSYVV